MPTPTTQDSSGLCRDHGGDLLHELICGCPRAERKDLLLRTPVASEAEGGAVAPEVAKANGQTLRLSGQMIDLIAPNQLPKLPTPTASDWKNGRPGDGYGPNLPQTATDLMPTPTTRDYKDGSQPHERDGKVQTDTIARAVFNSGEVLLGTPRANAAASSSKQVELGAPKSRLEDQVHTDWGKFEPAIRRWETILDRPAPEPTKPDGKEGNHRLSSKFTEWMMGLPDGWITDIGLKRNDELKACGNGVVPQQAELALSLLGIKELLF